MLTIDNRIYGQMATHAEAERPLEACGLLAGIGGRATRFFPCTNAARSPVFFTIDPREQLRRFRTIDAEGLELLAVFHSHPSSEAWPSKTDVAHAHYPEVVYLIMSLAEGTPGLRAFCIRQSTIEETGVAVVEA